MASKSQDSTSDAAKKGFSQETSADKSRLPFEPVQRKKSPKQVANPTVANARQRAVPKQDDKQNAIAARAFSGIPDVVSQRMVRRVGLFCGIPTGLGILTFVVSYVLVSQHIYKIPPIAVLLVSLGFFGLGVMGLSYGALSASWDEDRVGTWFGWSEFTTNFRRTIDSWKTSKNES